MSKVKSGEVKSVAIIGGGASGAIALSALVNEGKFDEIVLYERRNVLGGVWVVDPQPDELQVLPGANNLDPKLPIPQFGDQGEFKAKRSKQQRYEQTPSYERLKSNVAEKLMTYSDLNRWDAADDERIDGVFVQGQVIQRYVETYLYRHKEHIVFSTTVESLTKDYTREDSKFKLTLRTETDEVDDDGQPLDRWTKRSFDAVVIATGHYHVPTIPNVPGIREVYHKFPGVIAHSKTFRSAERYRDQTILVVGSRASGSDISALAVGVAKQVILSRRTVLFKDIDDRIVTKPVISRYEVVGEDFVVHFEDGSTVTNPDRVVYGTGFRYSYPFLNDTYPGFLTKSGTVAPDLYQHTFYNKDHRLAVVGAPIDAISFRAFEYQAVLVARFFAQKIELPPLEEQIRWCLTRYQEKGDTRLYHTIDWGKKLDWLQLLKELGGGGKPIGGAGRPFPEFSQSDFDLLEAQRKRFGIPDPTAV